MNIEVGMKCKQVKVIEDYGFDYIGEEFEITKVTDSVIMGRGYEVGVGFGIEADKFEEYFELSKEENEAEIDSIEFTYEELQMIYDCLCNEKIRCENLINKLEDVLID